VGGDLRQDIMSDDDTHRLKDAEPSQQPDDAPRDKNDDPILPDDSGANVQHTVNESADKITLKTKIKRGTGTRDQDEINVKVKGSTPQETADKLHETVVAIGDNGTVNALRGTQPSGGSGE